jgi:hypothetical protein
MSVLTAMKGAFPKMDRETMSKAFIDGHKEALPKHREIALPRHFKSTAPGRYGGHVSDKRKLENYYKHLFSTLTPAEAEALRAQLNAGGRDGSDDRPMWHTGNLEQHVGNAPIELSGSSIRYNMRMELPPYAADPKPGQIKPAVALATAVDDEAEDYASILAAHVIEVFESGGK